jgi:hypothetical protein
MNTNTEIVKSTSRDVKHIDREELRRAYEAIGQWWRDHPEEAAFWEAIQADELSSLPPYDWGDKEP